MIARAATRMILMSRDIRAMRRSLSFRNALYGLTAVGVSFMCFASSYGDVNMSTSVIGRGGCMFLSTAVSTSREKSLKSWA